MSEQEKWTWKTPSCASSRRSRVNIISRQIRLNSTGSFQLSPCRCGTVVSRHKLVDMSGNEPTCSALSGSSLWRTTSSSIRLHPVKVKSADLLYIGWVPCHQERVRRWSLCRETRIMWSLECCILGAFERTSGSPAGQPNSFLRNWMTAWNLFWAEILYMFCFIIGAFPTPLNRTTTTHNWAPRAWERLRGYSYTLLLPSFFL